jgi:hypothetical protein
LRLGGAAKEVNAGGRPDQGGEPSTDPSNSLQSSLTHVKRWHTTTPPSVPSLFFDSGRSPNAYYYQTDPRAPSFLSVMGYKVI